MFLKGLSSLIQAQFKSNQKPKLNWYEPVQFWWLRGGGVPAPLSDSAGEQQSGDGASDVRDQQHHQPPRHHVQPPPPADGVLVHPSLTPPPAVSLPPGESPGGQQAISPRQLSGGPRYDFFSILFSFKSTSRNIWPSISISLHWMLQTMTILGRRELPSLASRSQSWRESS